MIAKAVKRIDVYDIVTEKMIGALENGTVPWRKTWANGGLPRNWLTQKPYSGINLVLLPGPGEYLTYKQAKEAGGHVRSGESGHLVVFFKMLETDRVLKNTDGSIVYKDNGEPEHELIPMLRYYYVFHISQCEGIQSKGEVRQHQPIQEAETIVNGYLGFGNSNRPAFTHYDERAYYRLDTDTVNVPIPERFESAEEYYATVFHEMVHSTGHPDRLRRFSGNAEQHIFGSESYSKEELVAEMGSAFLMGMVGMDVAEKTFENSAAYIRGWLEALRNNKHLIVQAASAAKKATEFILSNGNAAMLTTAAVSVEAEA